MAHFPLRTDNYIQKFVDKLLIKACLEENKQPPHLPQDIQKKINERKNISKAKWILGFFLIKNNRV